MASSKEKLSGAKCRTIKHHRDTRARICRRAD
ncbi:hypothetical protein CIB84_016426 [Bambusicola thoracicus]|uniref:Uncharacterized protein n=1 Tax=Bambusicola thoracicus TaxID=9083 RepID=A0A2P4S6W6_BAMTH|nr:hypothetical protein CIB84_016426 [Bambusicola thoracicus]